jgi:tetratricopeptide (TPR) repeat protein
MFLSSSFGVISQEILYRGERLDFFKMMDSGIVQEDLQKAPLFEEERPSRLIKRIRLDNLSIEELRERLKKNRDNITLLKYLGMAYSKVGRNREAKEIFEKILLLAPMEWKVLRKLGDTYYNLRQYQKAIKTYQKTLKFQPDDISTHSNLGTAFFIINNTQNAIKHFKKVLKNDPKHLITLNNLGLLYLRTGRAKESIPLLEKANQINPSHLYRQIQLGKAYEGVGEYIKAERLYFKILKKNPKFAEVYNSLAEFYLNRLNQPENSKIYFKKSLSIAPRQPRSWEIRNILKKLEKETD